MHLDAFPEIQLPSPPTLGFDIDILNRSLSKSEISIIISDIDKYYKKEEGKRILYPCDGRFKEIQQRIKSRILDDIELPNFFTG